RIRPRDFVIRGEFRDPSGIRTRAAAVRGQCPRPLNDGAVSYLSIMPHHTLGQQPPIKLEL
ncbi:MAG: hypothetical protein RLZZ41_781, partial [Actinomycetota bacterium]